MFIIEILILLVEWIVLHFFLYDALPLLLYPGYVSCHNMLIRLYIFTANTFEIMVYYTGICSSFGCSLE